MSMDGDFVVLLYKSLCAEAQEIGTAAPQNKQILGTIKRQPTGIHRHIARYSAHQAFKQANPPPHNNPRPDCITGVLLLLRTKG